MHLYPAFSQSTDQPLKNILLLGTWAQLKLLDLLQGQDSFSDVQVTIRYIIDSYILWFCSYKILSTLFNGKPLCPSTSQFLEYPPVTAD